MYFSALFTLYFRLMNTLGGNILTETLCQLCQACSIHARPIKAVNVTLLLPSCGYWMHCCYDFCVDMWPKSWVVCCDLQVIRRVMSNAWQADQFYPQDDGLCSPVCRLSMLPPGWQKSHGSAMLAVTYCTICTPNAFGFLSTKLLSSSSLVWFGIANSNTFFM